MPNTVACVRRGIRRPECFFGHEVLKPEGIKSDQINIWYRIGSLNILGFLMIRKEMSNPRSQYLMNVQVTRRESMS